MKSITFLLFALALSFSACKEQAAEKNSCCSTKPAMAQKTSGVLPEASLYQLNQQWKNQNGEPVQLSDFKGIPVVMTMIFTHCEYACPMMVNDLKMVEDQFTEKHQNVKFVLISFDHERDTPDRLLEYAKTQQLGENWVLLHGQAEQVKELAMVLDISYEQLENGAFAHANKKFVLNAQGELVFSQEGLQTKAEPVLKALNKLL
ncbi:MAG: SCO family protein [Bacteroidetes bacterium]|jgi:protein SCO1/2|nr:SCO family protein [Bacteroidota bacterium]